jgi:ribose transport system substrate-binding protein
VTALIDPRYRKAGRLEADWVIKDTNGQANTLVVNSADIVPSNGIVAAIKDEFARYCGSSCKVTVINEPGNAWPKIQGAVQSALVKDPTINYVIPLYDSMSQWVVPAIQAAGRTGKVHIATYNGTPFVMKMLQTGDVVRMEVGENLDWLGWASMDQIMRVLTGTKPVKDEHTALRVFTKQNIGQAGKPPKEDVGYGAAYRKGYNKLWKK